MRIGGSALMAIGSVSLAMAATDLNDYPTAARADYVFACMKANGDTRQALVAETVLSLAQVPGVFGAMFRTPEPAKSAANDLRRAQAEAEVRCF